MNRKPSLLARAGLAVAALTALVATARAQQPFTYLDSDLCLTFRKVAPYTENNEVVVNLGQASTYVNASLGTKITVNAFTPAQLAPGSFTSLNNLSWAVVGYYVTGTGYAGYPAYTLWLTVPRTDHAVRSADASRYASSLLVPVKNKINSILANAAYISHDIATSNLYNNATLVREARGTYATHVLGNWMQSSVDNTYGTLNDTWADNNLEKTTPEAFATAGGVVRSDLYEIRPLDNGHGGAVDDPHTGSSGLAYYVGYFELKSDGTLTFTRESSTAVPQPPPPPKLTISRAGTTATISFVSSNSATYRLFFTNAAGLTTPVTSWPSAAGTITGDGATKSFLDTTTDPSRFYRVQGQ